MDAKRITHDFTYHAPDAEKVQLHEGVRTATRLLAEYINLNILDSREKSLAITKLEEVGMWAHAAIARNPRPEEAGDNQ